MAKAKPLEVTSPRPFVFVLMPFAKEFDEIYKKGIKATCDDHQAYCERVDEQVFEGIINLRVYNQISKADVIVADLTGGNPNVCYEVGYAHALGKRTVLITQSVDDIPFDLRGYPNVIYEGNTGILKAKLGRWIRWLIDNPNESGQGRESDLQVFFEGNKLSEGKQSTIDFSIRNKEKKVSFSIYNPLRKVVSLENTQLSLVTPRNLFEAESIQLPDGDTLFKSEIVTSKHILPEDWVSVSFILGKPQKGIKRGTYPCKFRIVTEIGTREIPFPMTIIAPHRPSVTGVY